MSTEKRTLGIQFRVSEHVARAIQDSENEVMLAIQDSAMNAFRRLVQQDGINMDDYCQTLELHSITKSEDGEFYDVKFKLRPKQ